MSGLNLSERMRQAAQGFTPTEDYADMLARVERVNTFTKEVNDAFDDVLSFAAESNKRIEARMESKP